MIYTYAERFRVRVYRARVEGGEIQLLVKARDRKGLADFLRVLAGRVATTVSGAKKKVKRIGKFWNELCWSRLIRWGFEFNRVRQQVMSSALAAFDEILPPEGDSGFPPPGALGDTS